MRGLLLIRYWQGRVIDALTLLRWQFWVVSLVPVLIGYIMSPGTIDGLQLTILLVIFGPCLEGGAEAINDYYDADVDKLESVQKIGGIQLSGGTGLLQLGKFTKSTVFTISLCAYALGVLLALCFFPVFFIFTVLGGMLLGFAYSAPPFRLKARGLLGPLSVGVSFGFLTLLGGFTAGGSVPHAIAVLRMIPLVLLVTGLFLTHQIVDYNADMKASVSTFCVRHGIQTTRLLASLLIFLGVAFVLASPRHSWPAWMASVLALVGLIWVMCALARGEISSKIRVAAVVLEATVGVFCLI